MQCLHGGDFRGHLADLSGLAVAQIAHLRLFPDVLVDGRAKTVTLFPCRSSSYRILDLLTCIEERKASRAGTVNSLNLAQQ